MGKQAFIGATVLLTAAVLGESASANEVDATPAIEWRDDAAPSGDFPGGFQNIYELTAAGWTFQLSSSASVSHLGMFDAARDGLAENYIDGLWVLDRTDSSYELLAQGEVSSGVESSLVGDWRVAELDGELLLPAGDDYEYQVMAYRVDQWFTGSSPVNADDIYLLTGGGFDWPGDSSIRSVDTRVSVENSVPLFSESAEHAFNGIGPYGIADPPVGFTYLLTNGAWVGPNVFFHPVPEPIALVQAIAAIFIVTVPARMRF